MIIVDTSIWIDFLKQSNPEVEAFIYSNLETGNLVALSVVFGELLQGVRDTREEKTILDLWRNLPKVDESNLFIEAGGLSFRYKLFTKGIGLIDCFLLAASQKYNFDIISLDKKLMATFEKIRE